MTTTSVRVNPYKNSCIQERVKFQRDDRPLLGNWTQSPERYNRGVPLSAKVEIVGSFEGFDSYGVRCTYEAIEVTLENGTVVPCYSHGGNYFICQNYGYKAYVPSDKFERVDHLKVGQKFRFTDDRARDFGPIYTLLKKPVVGSGATHLSRIKAHDGKIARCDLITDRGQFFGHCLTVVSVF